MHINYALIKNFLTVVGGNLVYTLGQPDAVQFLLIYGLGWGLIN